MRRTSDRARFRSFAIALGRVRELTSALFNARESALNQELKLRLDRMLARAVALEHALVHVRVVKGNLTTIDFVSAPLLARELASELDHSCELDPSRSLAHKIYSTFWHEPPPASAEWLLSRLVPPDWKETAIEDFLERHEREISRVGAFRAQMDYWWQVSRSMPGFLRLRIRRLPARL